MYASDTVTSLLINIKKYYNWLNWSHRVFKSFYSLFIYLLVQIFGSQIINSSKRL